MSSPSEPTRQNQPAMSSGGIDFGDVTGGQNVQIELKDVAGGDQNQVTGGNLTIFKPGSTQINQVPLSLSRDEHRSQHDYHTMLKKVREIWIDGGRAHSPQGRAIPVDIERHPSEVKRPQLNMYWQYQETEPELIPPRTKIINLFKYDAGATLLILGEPGSGKTTMLLELTHDLLVLADQNKSHRIPIVFNLLSWSIQQRPFIEWFVTELQGKLYGVSENVARSWVEQDKIIPLLDGLDEVDSARRSACIGAINTYRNEYGLTPLVVCSRTNDYAAAGIKLELSDALVLKPFTPAQINEYLATGGALFDGVRRAMHHDELLQELARTPLLLVMMVQAYRHQIPGQVTADNLEERRCQLFKVYTEEMLTHRGRDGEDISTTMYQLVWLAHQMTKREQLVFLIEGLQPDWLPEAKQQSRYRRTVELVLGAVSGLTVLVVLGLSFWIVGELGWGLIIGLVGALISGWVFGRFSGQADIVLIEKIRWSWKYIPVENVTQRLIGRWIGGLSIGIALSLTARPSVELSLQVRLVVGLIVGLGLGSILGPVWMIFDRFLEGLVSGLVNESVSIKTIPNEGIKRSVQNSMLVGLLFGISLAVSSGVISALLLGLVSGLRVGLGFGVTMGLGLGLVGGWFRGGGMAVAQHYSLRFWLYWYGYLPWRLESFLDLAAERVILQKVGGGYRFFHRLLQDYLASLSKG